MLRPVQILVSQLGRRLGIAAHDHTVDHAADERGEAEDQENDAKDPAIIVQ